MFYSKYTVFSICDACWVSLTRPNKRATNITCIKRVRMSRRTADELSFRAIEIAVNR